MSRHPSSSTCSTVTWTATALRSVPRDATPVDEHTPKLGSLTMEDIVATDAQSAGCYFDGLPKQPSIERVSMKNVMITSTQCRGRSGRYGG